MADLDQSVPGAVSQLRQPDPSTEIQPANTNEGLAGPHNSSSLDRERSRERPADSAMSQPPPPSRGGTLKKRRSLSRKGSLKRKSSHLGTFGGHSADGQEDVVANYNSEMNDAFYTPVPTRGSPTEILANRFQGESCSDACNSNGWRKVLKDLITYFRDIQKSYDARSKSLFTLSHVANSMNTPSIFLAKGGIGDAVSILRTYHQQAISEGHKVKAIEDDVIAQLTGLRSDLQQKIKEIKGLAGDFKNNVDKEVEVTKRAVQDLQLALGHAAADPGAPSGKGDPFIVKIGVERQLERQIEEENYLHRAFLNLESSGRELESIVIGEIQKAYLTYATILRKEADETYNTVEKLEAGPLAMAKESEWDAFVTDNENFVDPRMPVRRVENITYAGRDNPAAIEVRSGMLERKSKYLKSYTPGWYVLSPSHLHEFKSPDRITSQMPLMSLHLPDQKLGSHSNTDSSSHKFMLKGRQSGGVHRGHAWVFRAESYDTMLAWYDDIKNLTEKTGEERNAFIRAHARSISAGSNKALSISDDGAMDEDEADQVPYSATASQRDLSPVEQQRLERPNPGGRFPSAITTDRNSQVALPPSSPSSSEDHDLVVRSESHPGPPLPDKIPAVQAQVGDGTGAKLEAPRQIDPHSQNNYIPVSQAEEYHGLSANRGPPPVGFLGLGSETPRQVDTRSPNANIPISQAQEFNGLPVHEGPPPVALPGSEYHTDPVRAEGISSDGPGNVSYGILPPSQPQSETTQGPFPHPIRHDSNYRDWMAPAAGAGGLAFGAGSVAAYKHHQEQKKKEDEVRNRIESGKVPQVEPKALDQGLGATAVEKEADPAGVNASVSPNTTSTQKLPPNVAWASGSESSVVEPHQILRTDDEATPTIAESSRADPLATQGLSPVVELSDSSLTRDPAAPIKALANRPILTSHDSVATISDLHIPGEYPRTNTTQD